MSKASTPPSGDGHIVLAVLGITRAESPYSKLPFIADVRATASDCLSPERVDELLIELFQRDEVVLERADMVQGIADKVAASELSHLGETWHYAGLKF